MYQITVPKFGVDRVHVVTVLKIMKVSCLTVDYITDVYIQGSQSCLSLHSTEKNKHFLGVIHLEHFRYVLQW